MGAKKSRRNEVSAALDSWFDVPAPQPAAATKKDPNRPKPAKRSKAASQPAGEGRAVEPEVRTATAKLAALPAPPVAPPAPVKKAKKVQATFQLPPDLLEESRDAVVYLAGPPESLTLAALIERGLRRELAELRAKYEVGDRFPSRKIPVRTGRPVGK